MLQLLDWAAAGPSVGFPLMMTAALLWGLSGGGLTGQPASSLLGDWPLTASLAPTPLPLKPFADHPSFPVTIEEGRFPNRIVLTRR